jgi:predicted phosphodiesterase
MSRVLVVGDQHEPFCLDGYLEHCKRVYKDWRCNRVVLIGDEVDQHAMSYHEKVPDGRSAGDEHILARKKLQKWRKVFPKAVVCVGNHTALPFRQAQTAGIPKAYMKSYNDIWGIRGWQWGLKFEIDGVLYTHGTRNNGAMAARNLAIKKRQSVVMGHVHGQAGIAYHASERDLIFGMLVGCGVDAEAYSMAYAQDFNDKPVISCGVVIDGRQPHVIPMDLGTRYPRR